jgi:hypothetical protein
MIVKNLLVLAASSVVVAGTVMSLIFSPPNSS